jgi:1-acyl-sn-glycerol-3-phosphate acyltransferase
MGRHYVWSGVVIHSPPLFRMPNDSVAPRIPPSVPQRRSAVRRFVGVLGLRLLGWRVDGGFPDRPKLVIIVAPHTSNWDFVVGFMAYLALEIDATWFGKHTLFWWPLGPVLRHFGGIPVLRSRSMNVVELYVREFARRERMVLALAPEGTRRRVATWRSGFYHIARQAGVPILPVAFDWSARRVRFFPTLEPTGDEETEIAALRSLYEARMARDPSRF